MVESEMHFWVIGVCKAEVNVICGDHDISHARARLGAGGWRLGNTGYIETNDARPDCEPPVDSYFISLIVGVLDQCFYFYNQIDTFVS